MDIIIYSAIALTIIIIIITALLLFSKGHKSQVTIMCLLALALILCLGECYYVFNFNTI